MPCGPSSTRLRFSWCWGCDGDTSPRLLGESSRLCKQACRSCCSCRGIIGRCWRMGACGGLRPDRVQLWRVCAVFFWFFPFLVQRCQNYGNHAQFNGPFPLQVIVPRAWEQEVLLCSYVFFFSRWYLIRLAHEQHMHQSRARIGKQGEDKPRPYATTFLLLKDGLMGKGKERDRL